jgi:hypothetical protein
MQLFNFQKCLTKSQNKLSQSFKMLTTMWYTKFKSFCPIFIFVFIIISRYTFQTLENSRTEIFLRLIFSSSKVFLSLGNRKKSQREKIWRIRRVTKLDNLFLIQNFSYNGRLLAALCDEALSCNNLTPWWPVAGRRLSKYFFNLWVILPL